MDSTGKDRCRCGIVGDSDRVSVEFGCDVFSFLSLGYGRVMIDGHPRLRWVSCVAVQDCISNVYQIVGSWCVFHLRSAAPLVFVFKYIVQQRYGVHFTRIITV